MKKREHITRQTKQNIVDAFWELYCEKRIEKINRYPTLFDNENFIQLSKNDEVLIKKSNSFTIKLKKINSILINKKEKSI